MNEKSEEEQLKEQLRINSVNIQKMKIEHKKWVAELESRQKQWLKEMNDSKELYERRWQTIRNIGTKWIEKATPIIEASIVLAQQKLELSKDLDKDDYIFIAEIQKGGRIAIPKPFRKYHNLTEGALVTVTVKKKHENSNVTCSKCGTRILSTKNSKKQ